MVQAIDLTWPQTIALTFGGVILVLAGGWAATNAGTIGRAMFRDVDSSTWFIFGVAWAISIPNAFVALTGGAPVRTNVLGDEQVVVTGRIVHLEKLCLVLLALIVLTSLMVAMRKRRRVIPAAVVAVGLSLVTALSDADHGQPVWTKLHLLALGVLAVTAVARPGRGAAVGAALFGISQAALTLLLMVTNHNVAVQACDRKCGFLGFLIPGIQGSENALGLALVLSAPFIYVGLRGPLRLWLTGLVAGLGAATGSRSALFAVAAMLVVMLLARIKPWLATMAVVGLAVTAFWLPFHVNSPDAYTGRGSLWLIARDRLSDAPWLGFGAGGWTHNASLIASSALYSVHNLWLDTLYEGGIVAAALLALIVILMFRDAARSHQLATLSVILAPVMALSALERPWSFSTANWLVWAFPAAVLATSMAVNSEPAAEEAEEPELVGNRRG